MKKKQAVTTILLIICGFLAYQLLRESPDGGKDPGDDLRLEKQPRGEEKPPRVETGEARRAETLPEPVPEPPREAIAGRVLAKENGQPVAGAIITLLNEPGTKTLTADDGSFRLAPTARQANDLLIRAPGGYGVTTRPQVPAGSKGLIILLDKASTLRGTTVFPDGKPAPNIELLLHSAATLEADPFSRAAALHGNRPAEARGTSDSQGLFSIGGLSERDWFLRAKGPGIVEQVLDGVVWVKPGMQPIEVVVEPGMSIIGKVLDQAGNPLPGLEVRAFGEIDLNITAVLKKKTDGEGQFIFDGLNRNLFELLIGPSSDFMPIRIDQVEPGAELLVEMAPADSISGRVIDSETSRPVEGAVIGWSDGTVDDLKERQRGSVRETVSDQQGLFNLRGVPREELEFTARAEGYRMLKLPGELRRNEVGNPSAVFRMKRAGRLPGIVRNEDGGAVAGARVELTLNSQNGLLLATAEANQEGRFDLGLDAVPGNQACTVRASHEDYRDSVPAELTIKDPSLRQPELVATLRAGGVISGKIGFDKDQLPAGLSLAGITLKLLEVEEGELAELNRSATSDANGEYRLAGLAQGEYVLRSDTAGFAPYQSEPLRLAERESLVHEIFFTSERIVTGQVMNQDGEPLRATISARDLRSVHRKRSRRQTFSDQNGHFRLGSLGPGPYRITAEATNHLALTEDSVSPPSESNFVLERYGWVKGKVRDESTESPLEDFSITVLPVGETAAGTGRSSETMFENSGGRFFIGGLSRGRYELLLSANGYLPLIRNFSISGEKRSAELDLKLSRGRSIELVVKDQEGRAIEGCSISAHLQVTGEAPGSTPYRNVFQTDDKGKARVSGLATGSWTLGLDHPRYLPHKSLSLSLGAETASPPALEVTLLRGASLRGKLNTPVVNGRKDRLLLMGKNLQRQAEPDNDRNYLFEGLPPGGYTLLHYGNSRLIGSPVKVLIKTGARELIQDIDGN
ncbi:MAG: carboxypeptidase regulatory-like domain-containing protein [Planctomycetota bacterium]|nr:carboxypeptidase regulatory-like domain-containing protein [Planctomycetota bacterium]